MLAIGHDDPDHAGMTQREPGVYRRWVAVCTAGELAGFGGIPVVGGITAAWALGMLAQTLDDTIGIAAWMQVAICVPAAVLILLSIGVARSLVLRGVVSNPYSWLVANVLGWLAGLPWTFLLPALLPDSAPASVWIATFAVAGVFDGPVGRAGDRCGGAPAAALRKLSAFVRGRGPGRGRR